MTDERKKWEELYRATDYHCPDAAVTVKPGFSSETMARLTAGLPEKGYAFITAWNPGSEPVSSARNLKQNSMLEKIITQKQYIYFEAKGIPHQQGWQPEDSFLILGITRDDAAALGREFNQRAILYGRGAEPPQLLFMEDCKETE